MADTLLTEREALTVRRNFPRFTEDQRAVATSKLESYRQAQEAAGLPLFPSRSQEIVNQRDKTQSIWLDGEEGWKKHKRKLERQSGFRPPGHVSLILIPFRVRNETQRRVGIHPDPTTLQHGLCRYHSKQKKV